MFAPRDSAPRAPRCCPRGAQADFRTPRGIKVTFRPPAARTFRSRFRFQVDHGEGFDVVLSGAGTYEEDTRPNRAPKVGPRMYAGF